MNHTRRTIHDILTAWGRTKRRLPADHRKLKSEMLARLSIIPTAAPRSIPWLSLALAGLAAITLFIAPARFGLPPASVPLAEDSDKSEIMTNLLEEKATPEYYPVPGPEPTIPITDPREFLKTDYHAAMRTRRVEELTRRIQTTVRGFGRRVDAAQSSPKWGSVSFVVPASRFDAFRNEVQSFVYPRFFIEETRSENLLPQKQSIERQQQDVQNSLAQLRSDREQSVKSHNRIIAVIQSQLTATAKELASLRAEVTVDPLRQTQIAARIQELLNEQKTLETRLQNENSNHANKLQTLEAQIREAEAHLGRLNAEDRGLLDTVATVRGTISLNWISVWGVIMLYLPLYWVSFLFVIAAVVTYVLHRRPRLVML